MGINYTIFYFTIYTKYNYFINYFIFFDGEFSIAIIMSFIISNLFGILCYSSHLNLDDKNNFLSDINKINDEFKHCYDVKIIFKLYNELDNLLKKYTDKNMKNKIIVLKLVMKERFETINKLKNNGTNQKN